MTEQTSYFERPDSTYEFYMRAVRKFPRITPEREKELSRIIMNSKNQKAIDKAQEEMVTANLLLVVKQSQRYHSPSKRFTLSVMDIIEEGNIGLMKAALTYDCDKHPDAKFATYATYIIRHEITRAIHESHIIRTPENHHKHRYEINKLIEKYGSNLTDEIIMQELGITEEMLRVTRTCGVTYLENFGIMGEDDKGGDWQNLFASPEEEVIDKKSLMRYICKNMKEALTERERSIIHDYYFDTEDNTLDAVGKRYGLSKERVRQILRKSIKKLRVNIVEQWNEKHKNTKDRIDEQTYSRMKMAMCGKSCKSFGKEKDLFEENKKKFHKIINELTTE